MYKCIYRYKHVGYCVMLLYPKEGCSWLTKATLFREISCFL